MQHELCSLIIFHIQHFLPLFSIFVPVLTLHLGLQNVKLIELNKVHARFTSLDMFFVSHGLHAGEKRSTAGRIVH